MADALRIDVATAAVRSGSGRLENAAATRPSGRPAAPGERDVLGDARRDGALQTPADRR